MKSKARKIKQRMQAIADKRFGKKVKIEPMDKCLHDKPCEYLDAPGELSPMCELAVNGIFYLERCPLDYWRFS